MKRTTLALWIILSLCLYCSTDAPGRGFGGGGGGFHGGGGFSGGGFHGGDFGGGGDRFGGGGYDADRAGGFGGYSADRTGGYSADRTGGYDADRMSGMNDHFDTNNFSADRFGSWGGNRFDNVTDNRAADRPIANDVNRNPARNASNWQSAFANTRFPTDSGLAKYSSFNAAGLNHVTNNWSHNTINNRANFVRNNFNYYNCFHGNWYNHYPGCWYAAGWASGWAWHNCTWPWFIGWWGLPATPVYYDYGDNIVYQNNDVYVDGQDVGTAQTYAQQATTLADQGQQANPPTTDEWQPLGVFALVPGNETSSNNLFQLAINKQGVLRGNYYDGLMDTTTPVYGSVDKKTQRAAWTIGKSNDRVFEAGVYNLTQPQTPVLVHFGSDRTQQWLLVRVDDKNGSGAQTSGAATLPAPQ